MSDVEFYEEIDPLTTTIEMSKPKPSKMVSFLVKHGFAKDDKSASYILLSISATLLIAMIVVTVLALRQPKINYNVRSDVLEKLPVQLQNNIKNAKTK